MKVQSLTNIFQYLLISLTLVVVGCNKDDKPKPKEFSSFALFGDLKTAPTLKFIDDQGHPIANAQVLIGLGDGAFPGNFGHTDENGDFPVPANWTKADIVTVDAPGYLRATYFAVPPESKVIILKKKFASQVQLKGETSGHPIQNRDGFVDFSLVMTAMTRDDLLNFQIQKVISPLKDTISVVGKDVEIPANVSLPRQTESYFIGITLDKPAYRLFFADKGVQTVFAARGRFPIKEVVDGFRDDKQVFELINYFSITGGSIRDVNLEEDSNKLDIPVMDLNFSTKKVFKAPKLPKEQVMVVLTASDKGGFLIPTDVKRLNSEEAVQMAVWNENPAYLAQVIKNKNEFDTKKPGVDRLSAILLPFNQNLTSNYLPLIPNPIVRGNTFLIPEVKSELNKIATYGLISDVKIEKDAEGLASKNATAVWEVYAPSWVTEIKLPEWKWDKSSPLTRFEVSLIGSSSTGKNPLGPQIMKDATHVTRSSVDF